MNKYLLDLLFSIFFFVSNLELAKAQFASEEKLTMFGSRLTSPIEMEVKVVDKKYLINAINKSYYPYEFQIKFDLFENLSPRLFEEHKTLHPGKNNLFSLSVVNLDNSPHFSFSTKYTMRVPGNSPDLSFLYLIPTGNGKTVTLTTSNENGNLVYLANHFKMNMNDTVFSARKGMATALPDEKIEIDRVAEEPSLEILHNDGTIAMYLGLVQDINNLKLGQIVDPCQPLGRIGLSKVLIFNDYPFQDSVNLKKMDIFYIDYDEQLIPCKNTLGKKTFFPEIIIKKEMTKKEIKKYNKGDLY
jgi:hypothetical protein